jgi:hypothetical protein
LVRSVGHDMKLWAGQLTSYAHEDDGDDVEFLGLFGSTSKRSPRFDLNLINHEQWIWGCRYLR